MKLSEKRYIITDIKGDQRFKAFLLGHNISIGSVISINYSPRFSQLINLTIQHKILSIRREDFLKIECNPTT